MKNASKTAVLLVNLGTPDSAEMCAVQRYLTEFLLDPRVIDISEIKRQLLVRGIIVPRRKKQVTASYKNIWNPNGSPLLIHSNHITQSLQELLGESYNVKLAMRYQNPSLELQLDLIRKENPSSLIILPLFPHYASATTGSIFEKVMQIISRWQIHPEIRFIREFSQSTPYIEALANSLLEHNPEQYDTVIFSFHGLPQRHIIKHDPTGECYSPHCCSKRADKTFCYKSSCLETATLVAQKARLSDWSCAFQSRLGKEEWLKPYLSDEVRAAAQRGAKRILLISPSFVADCLETLYELGVEVKHEFLSCGGQVLDVVSCLNERAARPLAVLIKG